MLSRSSVKYDAFVKVVYAVLQHIQL